MLLLILAASVLVYLAVVWNDLFHRSIPDVLSIAIVGFAILRLSVAPHTDTVFATLATTIIVFLIGLFFFARGWLGGGDVKLVSATILLVGAEAALSFLLLMALAGGVLSVLVLIWASVNSRQARRQKTTVPDARDIDTTVPPPISVPYGVAISFSAILVLFPQLYQR